MTDTPEAWEERIYKPLVIKMRVKNIYVHKFWPVPPKELAEPVILEIEGRADADRISRFFKKYL